MVVYEWFARISQVLAPDKKYNDEVFDEPAKQDSVSLWHILAPDPNFTTLSSSSSESNDHTQLPTPKSAAAVAGMMHTPIANEAASAATVATYKPSPFQKPWKGDDNTDTKSSDILSSMQSPRSMVPFASHDVEQQVLIAAKDRATHMTSQVAAIRASATAYRICKNSNAINSKIRAKLKEMIESDRSLLHMRSSGTMYECPDGYTLFMAATHANQIGAMEVILDCCTDIDNENDTNEASKSLFISRNLEGKSALHIAAERGHIEALEFIEEKTRLLFGSNDVTDTRTSVDLLGYTALGLALLSPEVNGKKNKTDFLNKLYSEKDSSIMGSPLPVEHRIVGGSSVKRNRPSSGVANVANLRAIAGMSEMPGRRVRMEDCTICHADDSSIVLAVCDGHGDEGHAAQYVAEGLVAGLKKHLNTLSEVGAKSEATNTNDPENTSWEYVSTDLCLHIDEALFSTELRGGTVGVSMVVTQSDIVVANIGDCRCILVQCKPSLLSSSTTTSDDDLVNQTKEITLTDSSVTGVEWANSYHVAELSTDHKPNLPSERKRIEKSGLKVIAEKLNPSLTIHKIQLSEGNKLATSRAFGDFEYKSNEKLELHEQAVIAIPEVVVHQRCEDDVFMIAACDGIWDVMTNEEVAMFVTQRFDQYWSSTTDTVTSEQMDATILPQIGDELLLECLRRKSEDNMSVVIVALSKIADRIILGTTDAVITVPPKQLKYESTTMTA